MLNLTQRGQLQQNRLIPHEVVSQLLNGCHADIVQLFGDIFGHVIADLIFNLSVVYGCYLRIQFTYFGIAQDEFRYGYVSIPTVEGDTAICSLIPLEY